MPPGQAKKLHGSQSAREYAPGQQNKNKNRNKDKDKDKSDRGPSY